MSCGAEISAARHISRRIKLITEVTAQVLSEDEGLTLCGALRLVDATRSTLLRLSPDRDPTIDSKVVPRLEQIIFERFRIPSATPFN